MKSIIFQSLAVAGILTCAAAGGQDKFPLWDYEELPQHVQPSPKYWQKTKGTQLSWGSTDIRYPKTSVPEGVAEKRNRRIVLKGWKGERVSAQAVVWTADGAEDLKCSVTALKAGRGDVIPQECIETGFVRYVMTDELNKDGKGGCGHRPDRTLFDSTMVADCIDTYLKSTGLSPMNTQPIWLTCHIPQDTPAGIYRGTLTVDSGKGAIGRLDIEIHVKDRTLPSPDRWSFHLDLWQNPFAVARYYQVPVWSQQHFEAMRPLMTRLAEAGQKVITATIMHRPWDGQTEDAFGTMVTWMKNLDGEWEFRFDIFDRWVEFMMSCGIDRQINCYSMVPWKLSFQYFDQATDSMKSIEAAPGEKEYNELWLSMLRAFSAHLREKGWFDICTIAMDERPVDIMLKTISVIRQADPELKISLAGNYHPEIENDIYDYCITINGEFPEDVVEMRRKEGKISTLYTCCSEPYPNTFTFSPAAEATWIGYHIAARNTDGYLRWAYNSWTEEPLLDSRFRTWAAGDTYIIYPGNRTSIRFEKLIEGIQAYEKIRILREEYARTGNAEASARLEEALSKVSLESLQAAVPASESIAEAKELLNL